MNKRFSLHSSFFSSLKQVEKRLKLDNSSHSTPPPLPPPHQSPLNNYNSTESLCSPLYLYVDGNHSNVVNQSSDFGNSETPVEFLSNSVDFPQTQENPLVKSPQDDACVAGFVENDVDEIVQLVELLGLSELESDEEGMNATCSSCHCVGGFYDKIVGMKGPKCGKEMERLNGWIEHFRDEKIEPFRLAHLLLGKASYVKCDDVNDGGFDAVEFPSTVDDFLRHDPPL